MFVQSAIQEKAKALLAVQNGHSHRHSEKPESVAGLSLSFVEMGIMVQTSEQSLLTGISDVALVCAHDK